MLAESRLQKGSTLANIGKFIAPLKFVVVMSFIELFYGLQTFLKLIPSLSFHPTWGLVTIRGSNKNLKKNCVLCILYQQTQILEFPKIIFWNCFLWECFNFYLLYLRLVIKLCLCEVTVRFWLLLSLNMAYICCIHIYIYIYIYIYI